MPSGIEEDRALFRLLIGAGLLVKGLIDCHSSKYIDTAIHLHCEDLIQPLIDYGVHIDGRNPCSWTGKGDNSALLRCAVYASCPTALKILLNAGANIDSRPELGCTVMGTWLKAMNRISAAQSDYECLEVILEAGAGVDSRVFPDGIPTILDMALLTKRDVFGRLLQYSTVHGAPVTIHGILRAAEDGMRSLETYLTETPSSNFNGEQQKILEYALVTLICNLKTVKVLLGQNLDVDARVEIIDLQVDYPFHKVIYSPLGAAVLRAAKFGLDHGNKRIINLLLNAGATITHTILASSIVRSGFELLQFLISMVGNVDIIGSLALARAICLGNTEAIKFLLLKGVSINSTLNVPAQEDDVQQLVLQFSLSGPWVHLPGLPDSYLFKDPSWATPPSLDMVEYIINLGADVNALVPTSQASMLHSAIDSSRPCPGRTKCIELVLRYLTPSTTQRFGLDLVRCFVLSTISKHGHNLRCGECLKALGILFRHGVQQYSVAVLTMLILGGASDCMINSVLANIQHVSPDMMAPAITQNSGTIDFRHSNSYFYGFSPLRASMLRGDMDLMRRLLKRGAEVNEHPMPLSFLFNDDGDSYGTKLTTFQMAIWLHWGENHSIDGSLRAGPHVKPNTWLQMAQLLLIEGAIINANGGRRGVTALQLAAASGDPACCMLLLENGASCNDSPCSLCGIIAAPFWQKCGMGDRINPLDWAAWYGRLDVVQLLVQVGAESFYKQATHYDGAIQMAKQQGHIGVVDLILQHVNDMSLSEWEAKFEDPGILGIDRIL